LPDAFAIALLWFFGVYAVVGIIVGLAFTFRGIHRIDPAAAHAPLGFRLIILPGVSALWPWAVLKWYRTRP
jgi:hypothetical protein